MSGEDILTFDIKTNVLKINVFRFFVALDKLVPALKLLPLFNLYLFPVNFVEHWYQQARDQEVSACHSEQEPGHRLGDMSLPVNKRPGV